MKLLNIADFFVISGTILVVKVKLSLNLYPNNYFALYPKLCPNRCFGVKKENISC